MMKEETGTKSMVKKTIRSQLYSQDHSVRDSGILTRPTGRIHEGRHEWGDLMIHVITLTEVKGRKG